MWLLMLFTAGCLTLFVALRCVLFVINGAAAFPVWGGLLFGCYLFA